MSEWNPYRTPGIRSEDESSSSPGAQFDRGLAEARYWRRFFARHPLLRRTIFWFTLLIALASIAAGIAHAANVL